MNNAFNANEIDNAAANFKVGDTVRFYIPSVRDWKNKTASYAVGTGVIVKSAISKEVEPNHFGRGSVKGASFGEVIFTIETSESMAMGMNGDVSPFRSWNQKLSVVMGMPFGGLAKA